MHKRMRLGTLALVFCSAACGNDDGGPVLGVESNSECLSATFAAIHEVISAPGSCARTGCHAGPNGSGGMVLAATKDEVYLQLVGVRTNNAAGQVNFPFRIEASSSTTSYLLHAVETEMPVGAPFQMGPLLNCEIEAIRSWIDAGAAND